MSEGIVEFLTSIGADSDTVQQAARYVLGDLTDDRPIKVLADELHREANDGQRLQIELCQLEGDPELLEMACLAFLSDVWETEEGEGYVRSAVAAAKEKLPVIEVGILAVVAIYAMWLRTTGGVHTSRTVVDRRPDGSLRVESAMKFYGPDGPLQQIVGLFTGNRSTTTTTTTTTDGDSGQANLPVGGHRISRSADG